MILIGVDGNEANCQKRVGVGQYAFQVLKQLYRIQNSEFRIQNNEARFRIYLKDKPKDDLPKETSWWRYKLFGPKKLWTQFALPFRLFAERDKPDIFFTPSHYSPRFSPCPTVMSVMDLSFIHFPNMFRKSDLHQLRAWTKYSVKKATKIFTISNFTKKDMIEHYKVAEDCVVVTYPGYDKTKFKVKSEKLKVYRIKDKYKIRGDYILFVGTLQPRKNIARLIEAYKQVKSQKPARQRVRSQAKSGGSKVKSIKLVIAGKKGWLHDEIFRKVKELGLEKEVIFTGYVEEDDLPDLYRGTQCLVLPSLYEGFGLPIVEAMACGCPVVVSNVSSLPEIVDSAGVLVNPYKIDDIVSGILQVVNLDENKRRDMIEKGIKQAEKFSWEKCVRKTLRVLKEVAK